MLSSLKETVKTKLHQYNEDKYEKKTCLQKYEKLLKEIIRIEEQNGGIP